MSERVNRYNILLNDALRKAIHAQNIIALSTRKEFLNDVVLQLAVERCLNIISIRVYHLVRYSRRQRIGDRSSFDIKLSSNIRNWSKKLNHNYQKIPAEVLWETVKEIKVLDENLREILGEHIDENLPEYAKEDFKLVLTSVGEQRFTSKFLHRYFSPYIEALSDLQRIIDEVSDNPISEIKINSIKKYNPFNVNIEGTVKAAEFIREIIVPWRRKHAKAMAKLEEQQKIIEIEASKSEIEKTRLENTEKHKLELERIKLENEKLRLELQESKINLALGMIESLAPDMNQSEKIKYVIELLRPLGVIVNNPLFLESPNEEDEENKEER